MNLADRVIDARGCDDAFDSTPARNCVSLSECSRAQYERQQTSFLHSFYPFHLSIRRRVQSQRPGCVNWFCSTTLWMDGCVGMTVRSLSNKREHAKLSVRPGELLALVI